jgi:hypothetical protein
MKAVLISLFVLDLDQLQVGNRIRNIVGYAPCFFPPCTIWKLWAINIYRVYTYEVYLYAGFLVK